MAKIKTLNFGIVLCLCAGLASSCSEKPDNPSQLDGATKLGKRFAQAIQAGDFPSAYGDCSSLYRGQKSLDAFTQDQRAALSEFEPILGMDEAEVGWTAKEVREMAEDFEIPADIPKESFRSWVVVPLIVEYDEDGENLRCFYLELLVVEDAGTLKAGHTSYEWCD